MFDMGGLSSSDQGEGPGRKLDLTSFDAPPTLFEIQFFCFRMNIFS